jgi:Fic family protein
MMQEGWRHPIIRESACGPPVVRAIIVHFMVGFDHYFADGNGRTARALFYWSMLHQGYWLSEYVTISKVLKKAPSKYSTAYFYTEDDEGDLTYFIHYQLEVFLRGLDELDDYLAAKETEMSNLQNALRASQAGLNHRQVAVLERLARDDSAYVTVKDYARRYVVGDQTARNDLDDLARKGLLPRYKSGRANAWRSSPTLTKKLGSGDPRETHS